MKIFYVIYSPYKQGYWSKEYKEFKGLMLSTEYEFLQEAKDEVAKILNLPVIGDVNPILEIKNFYK